MKTRKKMLAIVLSVCAAIGIVTAATASADRHGGENGRGERFGSVTGFPNTINTVDLSGYEIVTAYPLGVNAGNTFQQNYTDTGVTAFATAGPDLGGGNFVRTYTAMPVGHDELFVTWFLPDGSTPDVFLMNFKTGIVSDVLRRGRSSASARRRSSSTARSRFRRSRGNHGRGVPPEHGGMPRPAGRVSRRGAWARPAAAPELTATVGYPEGQAV